MENIVNKIFNLLSKDGFKDPDTGSLFFPAYIYTYPPESEFEMRQQIKKINELLKRPNNNLNCLTLNIFEELVHYLKEQKFAGMSILDQILKMEESDSSGAEEYLKENAHSDTFFEYLGQKFLSYFEGRPADKVYLLLFGFGTAFPYLRASSFLKNTEKYIKDFKLILFYPGSFRRENYSLFEILNDDNLYRAIHLNTLLK